MGEECGGEGLATDPHRLTRTKKRLPKGLWMDSNEITYAIMIVLDRRHLTELTENTDYVLKEVKAN